MKGEFIILVVCAALVHISVVKISPVTAAIPKETTDDNYLMGFYQNASILQVKQAVQYIFPQNVQDYLGKGGLTGGVSNGGNLTEIETCTNILFVRGIGVIDADAAITSIVDSQTYPAITSAHTLGVNGLIGLCTDICTALKLAATEHSSTAAAKIQAMADKQVSAATYFNKPYFDAIRASRNFQPEMEDMFRKCERRSSSAIVNAFNETFNGIQEFASLGGFDGRREEILSTFDTFRERVIFEWVACLEAKFDIAQILFTYSQIIQPASQHETVTLSRGNQNRTATAALETEKGISAVFNTILSLLAKASLENQNLSSNASDKIETASNKTSAAFVRATDAAFNAISQVYPECSSIGEATRATAEDTIKTLVDSFYEAIAFIRNGDIPEVPSELRATEDRVIQVVSQIIEGLFDKIHYCVQQQNNHATDHIPYNSTSSPSPLGFDPDPESDANLVRLLNIYKEKAVSGLKEPFHQLFTSIIIRTAQIASGIAARGIAIVPIKDIQTEVSTNAKAVMDIIYDALITLLKISAVNQPDVTASLSAIGVYRGKTRSEIDKAYGIIFSNIIANNQNIPEVNSSDIIEAGRAVTSAAYANALENIVREFPPNDTESISAPIKEAADALQQAVDGVYMTIQEAQGNNSCELRPKLAGMEDIGTRKFADMSSQIYVAIHQSLQYNVEIEPTLVRTKNVSISSSNEAAAAIFRGIRTLADANCPGIQTSSIDNLSSVTADYHDASSKLVTLIGSLFDAVSSISD